MICSSRALPNDESFELDKEASHDKEDPNSKLSWFKGVIDEHIKVSPQKDGSAVNNTGASGPADRKTKEKTECEQK